MSTTRTARGVYKPGAVMGGPSSPSSVSTTVGGLTVQPAYRVGTATLAAQWTDTSGPLFWRALYTGAALGYLGFFHFSLPGGIASVGRAGGSLPHGHGMAVALYFASWMIVIEAARDVIAYAYPDRPFAATLHEAV